MQRFKGNRAKWQKVAQQQHSCGNASALTSSNFRAADRKDEGDSGQSSGAPFLPAPLKAAIPVRLGRRPELLLAASRPLICHPLLGCWLPDMKLTPEPTV